MFQYQLLEVDEPSTFSVESVTPEVLFDPFSFDSVLIMMSGGKDSIACLLQVLELGIPKERIEIWHHDIDGEGGDFMDWPVTKAYVTALAKAFDLPVFFSWREGGFEREMNRHNALTAPTWFETPDGLQSAGGVRGTPSTRRKFPQLAASLSTRWCSSSLKIDVCSMAIANQARFNGKRTLIVTGERAEESSARAKYKTLEPHKTSNGKRTTYQWRSVHGWSERQIWDIIARHKVNPHPAYQLGWGRTSCLSCIFGSPDQWASVNQVAPQRIIKIANYEREFGVTIRRDGPVEQSIAKGTPYKMDPRIVKIAMSAAYDEPIFVDNWELPLGAFGDGAGPT